MQTNVELDDALVEEALRLTSAETETELLHQALETLIQLRKQNTLVDFIVKFQLIDASEDTILRPVCRINQGL
ncbi:MAG: type II toxin-antitoxin system VapB family antitoxin [Cyanobacteria bacterium J06636_16]